MKLAYLVFVIFLLGYANADTGYDPERIVVRGKLIVLSGDRIIKHQTVFLNEHPFRNGIDRNLDDHTKSDSHGEFMLHTWIDKNNPCIYLHVDDYAEVAFINCHVESSESFDTLDLGNIYLAQYDNELTEERYNMPRQKQPPKKVALKSVSEIDSTLKSNPEKYDMYLTIDTTQNAITRYNFGPKKPRGTTIQSYLTIQCVRDMSLDN